MNIERIDAKIAELQVLREQILAGNVSVNSDLGALERLETLVCRIRNVERADLQSNRRPRWLADSRHMFWLLARRHTRLSCEKIAFHFWGNDHGSLVHGAKSATDIATVNASYRAEVERIELEFLKEGRRK
jgi:chromosomal replication initiation ATPase DnaA